MKIVQISAVLEQYNTTNGGTLPYEDATVYGLGNDNKLYYWGFIKRSKTEREPDEEGNTITYNKEYGWIESGK